MSTTLSNYIYDVELVPSSTNIANWFSIAPLHIKISNNDDLDPAFKYIFEENSELSLKYQDILKVSKTTLQKIIMYFKNEWPEKNK